MDAPVRMGGCSVPFFSFILFCSVRKIDPMTARFWRERFMENALSWFSQSHSRYIYSRPDRGEEALDAVNFIACCTTRENFSYRVRSRSELPGNTSSHDDSWYPGCSHFFMGGSMKHVRSGSRSCSNDENLMRRKLRGSDVDRQEGTFIIGTLKQRG